MNDQLPPERFEEQLDPISSSETSQNIEPEHPHWSLWLFYLFLRPKLFFQTYVLRPIPVLTVLTAWLYGIALVMDQIESRRMQGNLSGGENLPLELIAQDWTVYWVFAAALGILGGALHYGIGGWWYRLRLSWCGAQEPDPYLARRVYIFSAQAYVVPYLIYVAWQSTVYPDPAAALDGDDLVSIVILVAMFWSIYVSYRGVRTTFELRHWAARIWFAILPAAVYAVMIGIVAAVMLTTSLMVATPDLDNPHMIEREGFTLQYPGNWQVDMMAEDYDPDGNITIAPPAADAQIRFSFYADTMDSQVCVDQTLGNLSATYDLPELTAFDSWGAYNGAGYRGSLNIMLGDYDILIFCSTERERPFEIFQIAKENAGGKLQSGFDLIRDSLELHMDAPPDLENTQ